MTEHSRFANFAVTFAAVFAIVYYFAVAHNWALFSYGPAVGQWTPLTQGASAGPTMYWYGWIATAALAAASVNLKVGSSTSIHSRNNLLTGFFFAKSTLNLVRWKAFRAAPGKHVTVNCGYGGAGKSSL
jgi:hypothetical protein